MFRNWGDDVIRAKFWRGCCDSAFSIRSNHLEQTQNGVDADSLLVSARALLVREDEERPLVRQGRRQLHDLGLALPEIHHG